MTLGNSLLAVVTEVGMKNLVGGSTVVNAILACHVSMNINVHTAINMDIVS